MENVKKKPKNRIGLFFVITAMFWFTNYAYMPTFTPYLKSENIGYAMIGAIGGAYGLAQLILRVPIGIASDRFGKRKIFIIAGVFFGTLSSFLMFFTNNPTLIWILRFTSGISASMWVVYTVLFSSYFAEGKTASRISILSIANTGGILIAKMTGSMIVEAFGYQSAFLLSGSVGVIAVIMSFFVKENVPEMEEKPRITELLSVFKNRNLLVLSILAVFSQMAMFATINTFTPEVAAKLGADSLQLGFLATLSSIPGLFVSMILGWLFSKKINFRFLVSFSMLLGAVGSVMTAYANNINMVYAASVVACFGFGICMTSLMSFCTITVDPKYRSVAMGAYQAIYSIGMFLGPVVVGVVADILGMRAGILSAAFLSLVGMGLALVLLRRNSGGAGMR